MNQYTKDACEFLKDMIERGVINDPTVILAIDHIILRLKPLDNCIKSESHGMSFWEHANAVYELREIK